MRKRVAFRALIILLASALLLTSTGAYNILVFADQNMELSSLSATDEGEASAPSVSTYGGELITEPIGIEPIELETQSEDDPFDGHAGTIGDPYPLNQSNFLDAYNRISNSSVSQIKYFTLTSDINISALSIADFHHSAVNSAAYLFSAEGSNPSAVNFVIDGEYVDPNDNLTKCHRIYSNSNSVLDASGYRYFALFGFMNENCVVKNIVIENINVNLMNAAAGSLVAFKNKGTIQNVSINNCSMTVSGSTANTDWNISGEQYSYLDNNSNTGNDIYPGFAAVAVDHRGSFSNVSVENFRLSVSNASHYIGGVVAQNRGTSLSGAAVNGLRITATAANAYIGGVCAYNVYDANGRTITNAVVDLPGHYYNTELAITQTYGGQIYGGRYVGGLVGKNDGTLSNSLIEGSFGTVSTPSAEAYDMCGIIRSDDDPNAVSYYYGGAVAGGSGTVSRVTVQNLGFFMSLVSLEQPCYFGGIVATAAAAGSVVGCVSTGSFASSAYSSVCHAGGVIAYAPANAAAGTLSNCYTLFRIQNKGHYLTGAVIGFGGTAAAVSNCYWSSEISGCVTAYVIPNTSDSSIIETISDRSMDLNGSSRAVVSRRNVTLSDVSQPISQPTHSWSTGSVTITGTGSVPAHVVQGVINSLDAAPYQQTLSLANASNIGYSGRTSLTVDFKLDVFIVASGDDIGDPNDPTDPLQISSSGMTRFLYLAPYANYVLTQDVTIDENEWEPVAFYGQLSGTYENKTHSIYAPCRVFSAVVGSRSANVTVDTTAYTTSLDLSTVNGGYIQQIGVILTPDYFVLETGVYNQSVFGSLFGATMYSVALTNDTDQSAKLIGSRQGVFADAAYDNTYVYGCSSGVSLECAGSGADTGAFIGYLDPSANIIDNCVIDADVTLASGSTATHVAAFIGNIGLNSNDVSSSYVLNSVVVATVSSGVAAVFGAAPEGETVAARRFHNIYWARNSHTEESTPIGGSRANYDGLILWGSTNNSQTAPQYYTCNHTLNSGDAEVELLLPQHINKINITTINQAKSDFSIVRLPDVSVTYNDPEVKLVSGSLVLSFIPTVSARNGDSDVFKVTHLKTGLCTYIVVTAQTAGGFECDSEGYYLIKSAADLKNLSDEIARGQSEGIEMAQSAFKLCADIDMSYFDGSDLSRVFHPIGWLGSSAGTSVPFSGVFIGATNPETGEPYTISNVTVVADSSERRDHTHNGLFGVVDATYGTTSYTAHYPNDVEIDFTKTCEIGNFNIDNICVDGGDDAGALIGSLWRNSSASGSIYDYPIHDICVTNSSVTGGTEGQLVQSQAGRRVGGLIGEVSNNSANLSGIVIDHVAVSTYYYQVVYSNRVATSGNGGYFSTDYFLDYLGIGGVIGAAYNDIYDDNYSLSLTITDTHVNNATVAGAENLDETRAYATMDAGGIVGSVFSCYTYGASAIDLSIGDPNTVEDVSVEDSQIKAYGNTGGIIGISDVVSVLSNCVVRGSSSATAPERSAMKVLSRTLYYVGGIAGYIGVSSHMAGDFEIKSSNEVYASLNDCLVENAYVAATETSYKGETVEAGSYAPMRNVSVGGIIGGGNGQGYDGYAYYASGDEEAAESELAPFVSGCTVNHSRIEGIVTGGIVGADAEIQYTLDGNDQHLEYPEYSVLDDALLEFRNYITHCNVTNSTITTMADATRIAGDARYNDPVGDADYFVLASGVGGIMGTNARFHYDSFGSFAKQIISYGYIHDTIIEYCNVDSNTTVESVLPFVEEDTNCTVAVGGVIGTAFTNCTRNSYDEFGRCVLRYNEVAASVYNSASYVPVSWDQNTNTEAEIKVGTGGFIGAAKGGANQYDGQYAALCFIPGIHIYTSVFSGRVSGESLLGGAIGLVNYASDFDGHGNYWEDYDWSDGDYAEDLVENGEVPRQMLYNLALAGTVSLLASEDSYSDNGDDKCYGGYVIGHISADDGDAFTFSDYSFYATSSSDRDWIVSDVTYSSLGGDNSHLAAFGFLAGYMDDVGSAPFVDFSDCYRDVNLDEYGDPLFDDVLATTQLYNDVIRYIPITEGNGDRFVIMEDDLAAYNWRGSDDSIASVVNACVEHNSVDSKRVTVSALRRGTVTVSIPFVGVLSDYSDDVNSDWYEKEVYVFCGFRYESPVQARLSVATDTSDSTKVFQLVQSPYDMNMVGYQVQFGFNGLATSIPKTAGAMALHYALYNPSGEIAFTDDLFAANGSFPGGLTPVGSADSLPFTGSFETLPAGTYTITDYDITDTQSSTGMQHDFTESVTTDYVSVNATNDTVTISDGYRVTLRDVQVKAVSGVGASLFGSVSGATFRNFDIDGMTLTGTTSGYYLGAVASKVFAPGTANKAPITIDSVNLNNFDFSEADYIGGLVGGIFANQSDPSVNTAASVISNCVVGNTDTDTYKEDSYANRIAANTGAGGLLAHSSQYAADITDCTVCDVDIEQQGDSYDYTNLDSGAAGVAMAYAGTMEDMTVEHCAITGEIVGGAVMRSYTSADETDFLSAGTYGYYPGTGVAMVTCSAAASVALSEVDIVDSKLTGTINVNRNMTGITNPAPYSASGGILARVDANTSNHFITNCTVDTDTTIEAVDAVGGIVGCLENPYGNGVNSYTKQAKFGVKVTNCVMDATLSRSLESSDSTEYQFNRGIGGVIGVFYRYTPLIFTQISGCTIGGTIFADNTAGGLVGNILTNALTSEGFQSNNTPGSANYAPSYLDFANMDNNTHFVSNCLISTNFIKHVGNVDGSPFVSRSLGIGVLVGYSTIRNDIPVIVSSTSTYYSTKNNYPFYHVMFSSANYSEDHVALFGFDNALGSNPRLNGIPNATNYCYDLNRTSIDPENYDPQNDNLADYTTHFAISSDGYLDPAPRTRINTDAPSDVGLLELFSTSFNSNNANTVTFSWGSNLQEDVKKLVFDTHTTNGAEDANDLITYEDYSFNSSATPYAFTTTSDSDPSNANAGEKVFSYALASVELANGNSFFDLTYPAGKTQDDPGNAQAFTLSLKENAALNEEMTLTVVFTYANGLKMSMSIFINVRAREYWRLDPDLSNDLDYTYFLVFNAADLAALQTELSADATFGVDPNSGDEYDHVSRANARIIQCYDVFWTISDPNVIRDAKAALKDENDDPLTLADVLGDAVLTENAVSFGLDENGDEEVFDLSYWLWDFVRPNPAYNPDDPENNEPKEISFTEYFYEYDYHQYDPANIPMEELVGDIGAIDYGVYGAANRATVIEPYDYENEVTVPFTGKYISLINTLEQDDPETGDPISTGVTEYGQSYAIYGLDLRAENTVANTGTDAPYAGLIAQIGPEAVVDGVRFINPKISVINSYSLEDNGASCCAGVLAGTVSYTDDDYQNGLLRPILRNISIAGAGDGTSYVKAIKRMNRASSTAGGLAGEISGDAMVYNVAVSGVDVVASYTANAQGVAEETSILIGGIAGKVTISDDGSSPTTFRNVDVTDCRILGGHIANSVGNIKSYGGGMFGIMYASIDILDADPITSDPLEDPESGDPLPPALSEVSGTIVGGSFIATADYSYDRDNQNNTALDIAGGVAAQSMGDSSVKYVNVIGSTIVGGDIAGGIVGQVVNKELSDSETTALTITNSGVGMQMGYDPSDYYTLIVVSDEHPTSVLVVGTSGTADRFNTAGGVVGNVQNLDNLYIGNINNGEKGVDFKGFVGTYGYDNHNREATAGGIIGSISGSDEFTSTELSSYLDKIQIYDSTVQGEINGFNRESVTDMKCAGSAGGIVGKIACAARKDINAVGDGNLFISECIMSARVNLYTSVYGVTVDCSDNQRNRRRDTNAGKLIGRAADGALIVDDCAQIVVVEDLWQEISALLAPNNASLLYTRNGYDIDVSDPDRALTYALRGILKKADGRSYYLNGQYCAINDYVQNVYGSSYPQDIVLYGNHNLCAVDFELYADIQSMPGVVLPYFDCNQTYRYIADTEIEDVNNPGDTIMVADQATLPLQMQAFMVSEGNANSGASELDDQVYAAQQYTENAFIPYQNAASCSYKYFRFVNPQDKLTFIDDQIDILDSNGEKVSEATAAYDGVTVYDEIGLYDLSDDPASYADGRGYTYNVGVMTIDLPGQEMVGSIVLNFAYGIQMNSSFTSIQINGDGSEQHPYEIAEPKHFYVMRALHSSANTYFKQVNNIDLNMLDDPNHNILNRYTTLAGFDPIGTPVSPFVAHFDGDGYVTSNLYINNEVSNATGLFGCVGRDAELKNIHVEVADSLIIRDAEDERTVVNGGIIGGSNTGGLIGMIKTTGSSNTTVTNCSVAGSNVIGGMNVGGLIGSSAGSATISNCFTSTTTASYASSANVGALLGAVVSGSSTLADCYTAGLAVAGSSSPSDAAVGGLIGRNSSTCRLTVNNCFVGATASGNTANTIGLAIAANDGTIVAASGNTVAVLMPRENKGKSIYVIAPEFISSANNTYESKMIGAGIIANADQTAAIDYTNASYDAVTSYQSRIASYDNASDAYSEAYRKLIAAAVKVDQSRNASGVNQIQTENIILNGGLLYPLTMTFDTVTSFTTSVYDTSDTVEYPMGVDLDLTGNGSNKNTDLLFKTTLDGTGTTIYRNIFRSNDADAKIVKYDGETYANGEVYYDYEMPYAVATQTVTVGGEPISIARKVVYPVASIEPLTVNNVTTGSKIFPIATARQLKALTSSSEGTAGTKFGFLRGNSDTVGKLDYQVRDLLLVADIDLASTVFTPLDTISEFFGNGHVISNMQINKDSGTAAMFTTVQSGGIYDLGLMGVNVVNSGNAATTKAAMLVGDLTGSTVSNCFAIGSVTATNQVVSNITVGGLVASASGSTIENSLVSGAVTNNFVSGSEAAGLIGKASGTVTIRNVTVTTNVKAHETYAVCGSVSDSPNVTVTNAVYGGQMVNANDGSGTAACQHLVPASGVTVTGIVPNDQTSQKTLYADNGLGLKAVANTDVYPYLTATGALIDSNFVSGSHFANNGMMSFGDGYYPVAATIDTGMSNAFKAGARFAAAAIQMNYVVSTDSVSSVSAPDALGAYGTAGLSADTSLGAYVNTEGGLLTINPLSMRLTRWNGSSYEAAPEVSGITGSLNYSMISPLANNYLVRTVGGVKVQKLFTLNYEISNASGSTAYSGDDRALITVENVVNSNNMSTTGLAGTPDGENGTVTTGTICENMMIQSQNGYYSLQAYCQPGSVGDMVNSVIVHPAYLDNGSVVVDTSISISTDPNDPSVSSFSATSNALGQAEDSGRRFAYLVVVVEMASPDAGDWGLQRMGGNWVYIPSNP